MTEIDYDRIEKIADAAAAKAQHSLITKTVRDVLKAYGIHDPEKMQKRMIFLDKDIENTRDIRKGFFGSIGGHAATLVITLGVVWVAIKGG